jgi:hypothetical protein
MDPRTDEDGWNTPEYFLHVTRWWHLAAWVSVPIAMILCFSIYARLVVAWQWPVWPFMVIGLLPIALFAGLLAVPRRQLERALLAADGRLCTSCGYDLRACGLVGVCPECGRAFDAEVDARTWQGAGFAFLEDPERTSNGDRV